AAYNNVTAITPRSVRMASLTIRNLDDLTKQRLRIRAARHGVSMEEEARRLLKEALGVPAAPEKFGQRLLGRFAASASEEFALPGRRAPRTPPRWDEQA
ncbi:MAG: FitA-like ribbon-helix-helix domain-containing protein, partial [Thermoflexales bacterium]